MQITFVGHAGLFIETRYGSILCDPWFNPAYFASWFPFPSNEHLDLAKISNPTYLFVSHMHYDHFDPQFLREHVSKDTTVLLPDYPLDLLERELRKVGFTNFLQTKNYVPMEVDGLRLMISAAVAPTDGPLGDSGLSLDDGEVRIFDQNDSRPVDLDALASFGPYDAHFLQFSGAIWFPMVYQYPEKMKEALGRKKRENELARALRFAKEIGAPNIFPHAGPPCFLDDALWQFNDFDRDPINTFPDQTVFLEMLQAEGFANGHLMIPGSVATLTKDGVTVEHDRPDDEVSAIFTEKRAYLEDYKARKQHLIDAEKASWPRGQVEILPALKEWFEPLLDKADLTCAGHQWPGGARPRRARRHRHRLPHAQGLRVAGRGVGLLLQDRPSADRIADRQPRRGLDQHALPLVPLRGGAQGRVQRVCLQLVQVPDAWSGCSTPRATTPRRRPIRRSGRPTATASSAAARTSRPT